jgi:oxygen-independent coproporphyrinogen-3 oxidase
VTTGVYIHVPFCKSRCSYCDFATDVYRSNDAIERYVDALVAEVSRFADGTALVVGSKSTIDGQEDNPETAPNPVDRNSKIDTIYFGGGTPSLLTAAQLERVVAAIHDAFAVEANAEFTLEMNPATVTPEKLSDFRALGVNRASFGVQTFDDRVLKFLARGHDSNDARRTFEILRATGFDNVSLDLIAGLPGQTVDEWERNLDEALALSPEHLSLYILEVHEGTPLAEQIRSGRRPVPDENIAAEMYELMIEKTAASGLAQYEISNFSKPGCESRHNSKYWSCEPVFGFGVSAHSFDGRARYSNERDTNRFVGLIEAGEKPQVEHQLLSDEDLAAESAFLGLRFSRGIDLDEHVRRFGVDLRARFRDEIDRFVQMDLVELDRSRLRLTPKGMVFSNEVFSIFV